MSIEDFIITVYCLVDNELKKLLEDKRLRSRGFEPKLSDAEVITMDIVGEFLGQESLVKLVSLPWQPCELCETISKLVANETKNTECFGESNGRAGR